MTCTGVEHGVVLDSGQYPDNQGDDGDPGEDDERHADEGQAPDDRAMQRQFSLRRRAHLCEFEAIGCGVGRHPLNLGTRISHIGHYLALSLGAAR